MAIQQVPQWPLPAIRPGAASRHIGREREGEGDLRLGLVSFPLHKHQSHLHDQNVTPWFLRIGDDTEHHVPVPQSVVGAPNAAALDERSWTRRRVGGHQHQQRQLHCIPLVWDRRRVQAPVLVEDGQQILNAEGGLAFDREI
ncbi:hypothetical protein BDBG_16930 [Blastomyces gilchristii SLH14081]|uniref:Uncharacterized protein n=1 Tax=Blastomyces gilchristii (strain SLH14081) TaxID=559298 RepID=A0A179ULG5_BLAGS|nr:uncharacterized protein BDBG_16930 [Blastomyces gilchristii SLH14081]OAT07987.1 hypothetical protein BDBG_16930 [Blastomyces gilchristii SLH14081]